MSEELSTQELKDEDYLDLTTLSGVKAAHESHELEVGKFDSSESDKPKESPKIEEKVVQIPVIEKKTLKERIFGKKPILLSIPDNNIKKCPKCKSKLAKSKAEHTETAFVQVVKCKNIYCDFYKVIEFKK